MELTEMQNIGAEMKKKLGAIGVYSAEELRAMGCKEAYFRLKTAYPEVCLVHLYTLYGAIEDMGYNMLPEAVRQDLKAFSDGLK